MLRARRRNERNCCFSTSRKLGWRKLESSNNETRTGDLRPAHTTGAPSTLQFSQHDGKSTRHENRCSENSQNSSVEFLAWQTMPKTAFESFRKFFPTSAVFTPFRSPHSASAIYSLESCSHCRSFLWMSCSLVYDDDVSRIHHKRRGRGEMIDNALFLVMSTASRAIDVKSVFIDFPPLSNSFNLNCLYSSAAVLHNFPFRADDDERRHRWNKAQALWLFYVQLFLLLLTRNSSFSLSADCEVIMKWRFSQRSNVPIQRSSSSSSLLFLFFANVRRTSRENLILTKPSLGEHTKGEHMMKEKLPHDT